jgi:hypothetical protein
MSKVLTQEYLKEILEYNPESGIFTWKVSTTNLIKIGEIAGKPRADGYCRIRIFNKLQYNHRLAWLYTYGELPIGYIDHIDGNPSNNRISNLRNATNYENQYNQAKRKNNTSGFKGVSWDKSMKKWSAYITKNCKKVHLGYFTTPEEASQAYEEVAREYHGEFYREIIDN